MKNKTVIVNGIEFDSRIFSVLDRKQGRVSISRPYLNSVFSEVVATDGYLMLIQKVDGCEKSGIVDYVISDDMRSLTLNTKIAKYAEDDFYKGKMSNFVRYIVKDETCAYPDYKRVIPEQTSETRIGSLQDFYADGWRLYYPQAVDVFPDGSYKVTSKTFKKGFFVSNHHESAFDFGLFEKFYKFFDYPDDAEVYYTGSMDPLLAVSEKERKTALVNPLRFDYDSEYVKIEGKKAIPWRVV